MIKQFVQIDERIENNTTVINEIQKISSIGLASYKIGKKYDIKQKYLI